MQTLVINGTHFELPSYCDIDYETSTKTSHIFFSLDKESEYLDFVNKITTTLGVPRFGHSLGIVFSDCHIFWNGVTPPNGVSIIQKQKDGKVIDVWHV